MKLTGIHRPDQYGRAGFIFIDSPFREKVIEEFGFDEQADEEFYLTADTVLNVAKRALEIFKSSEVPEKRHFLNFLLQNCELQGKKLEFSLRSPFDRILATRNRPICLRIVDNVRTIIQQQNEYIYIPDLRPEALRAMGTIL